MSPVSVIIPLAPGEQAWRDLVDQLDLPMGSEVILAAGDQQIDLGEDDYSFDLTTCNEGRGRAGQMNAGSRVAKHEWLWFLHADTRLGDGALRMMRSCITSNEKALFFFDLKFSDDGPSAMSWNEWAVKWRAGTLKLPFGDQAFMIRRDVFEDLGGYREDLPSGEDHILVWKAHHMGVPVMSTGTPVYTSARRYQDRGWLATTLRFVWLTILQGVPQWFILQGCRLKRLTK